MCDFAGKTSICTRKKLLVGTRTAELKPCHSKGILFEVVNDGSNKLTQKRYYPERNVSGRPSICPLPITDERVEPSRQLNGIEPHISLYYHNIANALLSPKSAAIYPVFPQKLLLVCRDDSIDQIKIRHPGDLSTSTRRALRGYFLSFDPHDTTSTGSLVT